MFNGHRFLSRQRERKQGRGMEVEAKVMGVDFEKTKGEKDEENREEKWWKHSIKVKGGGGGKTGK